MAEFKDEIAIFRREYQSNFAENFESEIFVLSLSYLADIFSHLITGPQPAWDTKGAKSFLRGDRNFLIISNYLKLCPTHFSNG